MYFIIGLTVGGTLGALAMCLLIAGDDPTEDDAEFMLEVEGKDFDDGANY